MNRPPRIPSYRLHKPTNQAIVVLSKKTYDLGRFGTTESKAEYNRILVEWLSGNAITKPAAATKASASVDLTITELAMRFWRHVEEFYVKDGKQTQPERG